MINELYISLENKNKLNSLYMDLKQDYDKLDNFQKELLTAYTKEYLDKNIILSEEDFIDFLEWLFLDDDRIIEYFDCKEFYEKRVSWIRDFYYYDDGEELYGLFENYKEEKGEPVLENDPDFDSKDFEDYVIDKKVHDYLIAIGSREIGLNYLINRGFNDDEIKELEEALDTF